jgi:hypothetical protein
MGVDDVQESLADLGEVVVDAAMHPGSQEREPFQEPLHVGIVAAVRLKPQGVGNLLVLPGEVGPQAPRRKRSSSS